MRTRMGFCGSISRRETDLREVSEEDLQHYQGALNSRPRKCLGYRQPSVVFAELRKAA